MQFSRFYCSKVKKSNIKIFKNNANKKIIKKQATVFFKPTTSNNAAVTTKLKTTTNTAILNNNESKTNKRTNFATSEYFENVAKVQMISRNLHAQIFGNDNAKNSTPEQTNKFMHELQKHGIDAQSTERVDDIQLILPQLNGKNIEEHFYNIAKAQVAPYERHINELVNCVKLPACPSQWQFNAGWTSYDPNTGQAQRVDYPEADDALVLDVEVCMSAGAAPTLATAVSSSRWYYWVSPKLAELANTKNPTHIDTFSLPAAESEIKQHAINELIPLGKSAAKLIVGHNVSYDRARIQEQYLIENIGTKFLDTMSMHVCVSGMTSYQRAMMKSKKPPAAEDAEWLSQSSLNSLSEVHKLYCGATIHTKETRNIFVEGSLEDIYNDFQKLMTYCANDVQATWRVLKAIHPLFTERFPHPVTLAGMLEIGSAYLPINSNWLRYINESNLAYEDLNIEAKYHLSRRADDACAQLNDDSYKKHLWLWDQDWSTQKLKLKAASKKKLRENHVEAETKFQYLYDKKQLLPVRRPVLPGYPAWYRKLCLKPPRDLEIPMENGQTASGWSPGATEISTGMQIAPKLLSLCWEGYPLHYLAEHGWGFLVPFKNHHNTEECKIPIDKLLELCPVPEFARDCAGEEESAWAMGTLDRELNNSLGKKEFWSKARKEPTQGRYKGAGVWCNKILEDCCYFLKLPHKNGNSYRVGNPLARDFLNKFSENVLTSAESESSGGGSAARVIEIARMMSYWRNNRDRIMGQMLVWLPMEYLPDHLKNTTNEVSLYGAICPQIVTCGTLTRRAMEPTWLTASNSQRERIGSELRALVQSPPGYKIVGADVDSQELWIASVLGDAYAYGVHGATPLGWMTLSGSKSHGTDMHSVTAKAVGISRDHAKVINYARIYGAGQTFAEGLLKQFNPTFSTTEAKSKAQKMFTITKGKRCYRLLKNFSEDFEDKIYSSYEASRLAIAHNRPLQEMFERSSWEGGTESAMFNRLEEIALQEKPVTPFLNCRLSRALESNTGDESRFLPTRVNWVVQSGAVDFLHLMLVSMRWLMGNHVRFCISFHDEIRYLVKDDLAYKAALAMHITNLLTRSFCSSKIGLNDLPMSVAFFSSVEVDTVLRKESTMDCKTPSNPHGLQIGYGIPIGESLNIYEVLKRTGDHDLRKWNWIK